MSQVNSKSILPLFVRPMTVADAAAFATLSARDPWRYLTPRLNIEAHGYDGPVVRTWGAFRDEGAAKDLAGIMLRYGNTAILADADGGTAEVFAPIVDTLDGLAGVRGAVEAVRAVRGQLQRYAPTGIEHSTFMGLSIPPQCPASLLALVRPARLDDVEMLTALYSGAYAMYRSRANVAAKLAETRVFVVEDRPFGRQPRRIASCALLNVEGRDAGLIGGVYTLPAARGRGYAAACTAALSLDLQQDGKTPCLFYENAVAGRVYTRLGFEAVGQWAVLYLNGKRK